jgi:carboxyl-terminal processing protease
MLDYMLPEGTIVYTEDKDGKGDTYTSDAEQSFDLPLVVLINGNSASASEIFAGAIKDYGTGTLVGTTTFGKGIVQRIYSLGDKTAVKLTVSRYYTPSGVCIHGVGIDPDVEVELDEELRTAVSVSLDEDNQFQRALREVKSLMEQ